MTGGSQSKSNSESKGCALKHYISFLNNFLKVLEIISDCPCRSQYLKTHPSRSVGKVGGEEGTVWDEFQPPLLCDLGFFVSSLSESCFPY